MRYGDLAARGRRVVGEDVAKGFAPVLARRTAAAGRGGRRRLTGDPENARLVIGKRRYDPEDERRHRQGALMATTGIGGAGALGYAGRGVRRDARNLRDLAGAAGSPPPLGAKPAPERGHKQKATPEAVKARDEAWTKLQARHVKATEAGAGLRNLSHRKIAVVSPRNAAYGAAGLGLLGVSGSLSRRRREERWD